MDVFEPLISLGYKVLVLFFCFIIFCFWVFTLYQILKKIFKN